MRDVHVRPHICAACPGWCCTCPLRAPPCTQTSAVNDASSKTKRIQERIDAAKQGARLAKNKRNHIMTETQAVEQECEQLRGKRTDCHTQIEQVGKAMASPGLGQDYCILRLLAYTTCTQLRTHAAYKKAVVSNV